MSDNEPTLVITRQEVGLVWKCICIFAIVLAAVGSPLISYFFWGAKVNENDRVHDLKITNNEEAIKELKAELAQEKRQLDWLKNRLLPPSPFPGITPR